MMRQMSALTPSPWVTRFAPLIAAGGEVLDLACGSGRHARWLAGRGFRVEAVDRDAVALELLAAVPHITIRTKVNTPSFCLFVAPDYFVVRHVLLSFPRKDTTPEVVGLVTML